MYELTQKQNTHQSSANTGEAPGDWGSSSVEPIAWGRTVPVNQEENLKQWNNIPTITGLQTDAKHLHPVPENKNQESSSNTENDEYKEDPYYYDPSLTHLRADSKKLAREDRDDEQEFNRIPIAGEDSDD
jgi:hypothetical protein